MKMGSQTIRNDSNSLNNHNRLIEHRNLRRNGDEKGRGRFNRVRLPEIQSASISATPNAKEEPGLLSHANRTPYSRKTGLTPIRS